MPESKEIPESIAHEIVSQALRAAAAAAEANSLTASDAAAAVATAGIAAWRSVSAA